MAGGYAPYPDMGGQWCENCGGYGCEYCMGSADDFDVKLLHWLLPYGAGGCGAQRWYDISADWVYMQRDDVASNSTVFATDGIGGAPVLGTDDLGFLRYVGLPGECGHPTGCRQFA